MKMKIKVKVFFVGLVAIISSMIMFSSGIFAEENSNRYNVVIVLDASQSMEESDREGLRFDAIELFSDLMTETGNVFGGIVFSNHVSDKQPPLVVQSSSDKNSVVEMLRSVPAAGYTNIGEALQTATDMLDKNGDPALPSVIVFMSDGNTDMPKEKEIEKSLEQKANAIQNARDKDIMIYSICLNADNSADTAEMQQISDATGGIFQEVTKAEDLENVFNDFYNLIYGTKMITVVDESFSESGVIEKTFSVPGFGVEEVNAISYGEMDSLQLFGPDEKEVSAHVSVAERYTVLKVTDIVPGTWKLKAKGQSGNRIKINMLYNNDLSISVEAEPSDDKINPADTLKVSAILKSGNTVPKDETELTGYSAELQILDASKNVIDQVMMDLSDNKFVSYYKFKEGTYYYTVLVSGDYYEKYSDTVGPLIVSSKANNTAPVADKNVVKKNVYFWPFQDGGELVLDLKTLASDEQDSSLDYQIVSTSFIEGADFSVSEDDVLTMENFSLKKGEYTVRATDSGGMYCDINIIVKSHNIGVLALIGLGILIVIALLAIGILLYIALTKPFYGRIVVNGVERAPRRGRYKLSGFGQSFCGLDARKCYFQAQGGNYVDFTMNRPVDYAGQKVRRIRINSGSQQMITIDPQSSTTMTIYFVSTKKSRGSNRKFNTFRGGKKNSGGMF